MWWLTKRKLRKAVDEARVQAAIEDVERHTAAEIVVTIAPFFIGDIQAAALKAFSRLGPADRIGKKSAVLVFLVPSRRRYVVLADEAVNDVIHRETWNRVGEAIARRAARDDLTQGVVTAVEMLGNELRILFPDRQA